MQPGQTNNPNGRPKGSRNKRTQEIYDLAEELDCSPLKILMLFAKGDKRALGYEDKVAVLRREHERARAAYEKEAEKKKSKKPEPYPEFIEPEGPEVTELNLFPPDIRIEAAKDLMPYMYGKRKPVDSDGNDKGDPLSDLINALRPQ